MELRIETIRKKAEVVFSDESSLVGCFFVSEFARGQRRSEEILDLLMGERSYLPFELAKGEIVILQKKNIMIAVAEENELERHRIFPEKLAAEITFFSGKTLHGTIYNDLPPSYLRLSDYLNQHISFFPLDVESRAHLVNARFIRSVRPA